MNPERGSRYNCRMKSAPKRDPWIDLDELSLEPPRWMPGEAVPEPIERYETRMILFDSDGEPVQGDDVTELAMQRTRMALQNPPMHRTFYRAGVPATVSTAYLGWDHSFGLGAPLIWETMIFCPDGRACWRYSTRMAALNGHRQIIAGIRQMQLERRARRA